MRCGRVIKSVMASFVEESFQATVIICDTNWLKGSKWEVMNESFGMKGQKVETEMAGNTDWRAGAECGAHLGEVPGCPSLCADRLQSTPLNRSTQVSHRQLYARDHFPAKCTSQCV